MLNIRCVFLFVTVVAVFLLKKMASVVFFHFWVDVRCCAALLGAQDSESLLAMPVL
jgi:hypothetical protein